MTRRASIHEPVVTEARNGSWIAECPCGLYEIKRSKALAEHEAYKHKKEIEHLEKLAGRRK